MRRLSLPYNGPYRIVEVLTNGLSVRPVDRPEMNSIRVNVDRVTPCPLELANESWLAWAKEELKASLNSLQPLDVNFEHPRTCEIGSG